MTRLVITDLDNTLWDWVGVWHATFSAMMEEVHHITQIPRPELHRSARRVFQAHHTTEYAFVLEEMDCLQTHFGGAVDLRTLQPAIDAFRQARQQRLQLYPGVRPTLQALRDRDIRIVAYTESLAYYSRYRAQTTAIDDFVEAMYSPPDHRLPEERRPDDLPPTPMACRTTPQGELKPSRRILTQILDDCDVTPEHALYIGDSLMKDIRMAQDTGVLDVHAVYGDRRDDAAYALLREVSHWSPEDLERERRIRDRGEVQPSFVAAQGFEQVLDIIEHQARTLR